MPAPATVACELGQRQVEVAAKEVPVLVAYGRFTRLFNLTGLPVVSVPRGFSAEGLPMGLQLAGRAFEEATVLRASRAYERETGWGRRRPRV